MLDSLRHFLLVVEHGTFTEAARRAHLTQPSLSASIKRLEEALGTRVLDRGPGGASPTAAGDALLPHAQHALAAVEAGRRAVAEVAGLEVGIVRLGAGPTAVTYILPPILAEFREEAPNVRFFLKEAEPCIADELIVVRSPEEPVDPTAFISFPVGSSLRELLERSFPEAVVVMELASIAAVKANVRAGIGKGLVSRVAVQRDLESGELVEVEDPRMPIRRTLTLIHRGAHRLPPAAARLRKLLLSRRPPRTHPLA
jgi:DNA-binding transcriptional LysR family regulator